MKVLERPGMLAFPGSVSNVLASISDEKTVEKLALALIDDLKGLCDYYKNVGREGFERNPLPGSRGSVSSILEGPHAGEYVGVGLGEHSLDFGFMTQPVVEFLFKRFEEQALGEVAKSNSSYDTRAGRVYSHASVFSTTDGTFWLDRTFAWFIRRRVD